MILADGQRRRNWKSWRSTACHHLPGGNRTGGANFVVPVMLSVRAFVRLTTRVLAPVTARGLPPCEDDAVHGPNAQKSGHCGQRGEQAKSTQSTRFRVEPCTGGVCQIAAVGGSPTASELRTKLQTNHDSKNGRNRTTGVTQRAPRIGNLCGAPSAHPLAGDGRAPPGRQTRRRGSLFHWLKIKARPESRPTRPGVRHRRKEPRVLGIYAGRKSALLDGAPIPISEAVCPRGLLPAASPADSDDVGHAFQ